MSTQLDPAGILVLQPMLMAGIAERWRKGRINLPSPVSLQTLGHSASVPHVPHGCRRGAARRSAYACLSASAEMRFQVPQVPLLRRSCFFWRGAEACPSAFRSDWCTPDRGSDGIGTVGRRNGFWLRGADTPARVFPDNGNTDERHQTHRVSRRSPQPPLQETTPRLSNAPDKSTPDGSHPPAGRLCPHAPIAK